MPTLRDFIQKINIRAELRWDEPLALHTSFRIGGPADAWVRPLDPGSAARLLAGARTEGIPLFVLGGGANILVGDRGFRGLVMDTSLLRTLRVESGEYGGRGGEAGKGGGETGGGTILCAGAGLPMDELCLEALARGLGGLEDFAGMPGSVGGSAFMNARCYEQEMSQVLAWVTASDGRGNSTRRGLAGAEAVGWSYKRSPYQDGGEAAGELILEAAFRLRSLGDAEAAQVASVMRRRRADREAKGHYRLPSAGSVFKNDRSLGAPTGALLDHLGLRGRRIGDALISPWHANIFVNAGIASAADMRALIELARTEARTRLGAELETEVLLVGEF